MSNAIPLPPLPFGWWKDKVTESEMEHFIHAHAAAVSAAKDERIKVLEDALRAIDKQCFSHVDGRDLFAQMHPRNTLDIKRRVDARETWFEGDWLTDLWTAIKAARAAQGEKP